MWQFILGFIVVLAAGLFIRSLLRKRNATPPGQTIIYDSNYQPGQPTSTSNAPEHPAYCKNCGNKLEDNASYCSRCGTKIN